MFTFHHRPGRIVTGILAAALLVPAAAGRAEHGGAGRLDTIHPVVAENGMVASAEAVATRIGVDVLKAGGNAIDAAVAVGFALAVTLPGAGNIGGGGFMVIHLAATGETVAIDYRETAPAAASRDMFLDPAGAVDRGRALFSHASVGVPGTVAGLALALERYGTISLAEALAPAIRLADDGIVVSRTLAGSLAAREKRLKRWPASAAQFFQTDGTPYRAGDRLRQPDLARSLAAIAADGADAFYRGAIAARIVADMAANDGLITLADLNGYRAVVRAPVAGSYRGYRILSMPPPSSGGVHLIQMLNILEGYPIGFLGHNGADTVHLMAEAMKRAYADRAKHLGDPDFWPVPVAGLTAKGYAAAQRRTIDRHRARPSAEIAAGKPAPAESNQTTHFSVIDKAGNAVANTYTLNFGYGTGIVAAGTGILLNNEMDDFSAKPGAANAYGLIGGEANAIQPGKRPLSSMTPTIVLRDGKAFLATGSPGGSRIITTTLQLIMNVIDHAMNIAAAGAASRMHHQWLPDELRLETGFSPDTLRLLASKGHKIVVKGPMGATQSVMADGGRLYGASDPRRPAALTLGF